MHPLGVLLVCLLGSFPTDALSPYSYNRSFDASQMDSEVLDHLLHSSRYDKRDSPPVALPIPVKIGITLLSLQSPDESSLHYEVEFLLHQTWDDPRLAHIKEKGGRTLPHLRALSHQARIWKPDIFLIKHGTFQSVSPSEVSLNIFENGTVFYTMRRHLVLNCEGDLHIFPFDSPMCDFNIESVFHTADKMQFLWSGRNKVPEGEPSGIIDSSKVLKYHNAYMIHNETLYCDEKEEWRGNYSCLKVRLHFTRDKGFYYTTVFAPGLVLVMSSFFTFWIEYDATPARVMLGVTTMLNFFTTSNKFRSKLPVVSNLTAMNMWDFVCMFFIYASFLEFIAVNYLARWVQDPEQQKKKKENAILDSLRVVTVALNVHSATAKDAMHSIGGTVESRLKEVTGSQGESQSRGSLAARPGKDKIEEPKYQQVPEQSTEPSRTDEEEEEDGDVPRNGKYTLKSVKKIDHYSRRIFAGTYITFALYFFIRYHAIEGALSIDLME